MHDALYQQLALVEDRLWWHQARRMLIRQVMRRYKLPRHGAALDVGCGTGGTLPVLKDFAAEVVGIDRSPLAVEWARRKNPDADIREEDAHDIVRIFGHARFDLITLLNVLEHTWVPKEAELLEQVFRVLNPGGVVIITSAAFPGLARRHDRLAMSRRRHTLPLLRRILQESGFDEIHGTYFNLISFPVAWLSARWDVACRQSEPPGGEAPLRELTLPPWIINEGMKLLMAGERCCTRILGTLPFGVTLLCTARKPLEVGRSLESPIHESARFERSCA